MTSSASTTRSQPLSTSRPNIHGRFIWHELLAHDVSRAVAFYPAVCGWSVATMGVPGSTDVYTLFNSGAAGRAGVVTYPAAQVADGQPPRWVPYVGVDDADATCRDALANGATQLVSPIDIPTVGRYAVLADPEGAVFAVLAPFPEGTPETRPGVGEFAWHEMAADDADRSLAFYIRLFGWEKQHAMDMGKDGVYQMFGRGGFTYGGFMRRVEGMPPAAWNSYVRVADLDASIATLKELGGRVVMGPHEVPNNDRVAITVDNQGAVISFVAAVR